MAKQTGALLVENFEQLSYLIRGFLTYKIPKTLGTAPISGGGGLAIEATDASERVQIPTSNRVGIKIPQLTEKAKEKISRFISGVNTSVKNPLDFGAQGFDLDVVIKAVNILHEEMKDISTILFINSPETLMRFAFRFAKSEEDVEELQKKKAVDLLKISVNKWTSSMNSDQILMSITPRQQNSKEALALRHDYVSLLREKGIMTFDTVGEAAKIILQMWTYGQYLENHKQ
jgi:acyl-CoA synthetase (NDP forming)